MDYENIIDLKHALKVAENWAEHHAKHANDLIAENHALREAGGLMRDFIGRDARVITERWDEVLAN